MRQPKPVNLNSELAAQFVPSQLNRAITAAIFGLGVCVVTAGANAATLEVTSNTDNGSLCTLREAIESINAGAVGGTGCTNTGAGFGANDTITFASSGSITLTNGELIVESDVTIDASSISGITVKGDTAAGERVLYVSPMVNTSLNQLTLSDGTADYGGGIFVGEDAALSLTDSTISGNTADFGGGIALDLNAELTVVDSDISTNTAITDGGGIYIISGGPLSGPSVSLSGSTLSNNTANDVSSGGSGGGLAGFVINDAVLTISNSMITNNQASFYGGGIYLGGNSNEINVIGGAISGNSAGVSGGGVSVLASVDSIVVSITGATISNNVADDAGGGLYVIGYEVVAGSVVTIENSIFSSNIANGVPLSSVGAGLYGKNVLLDVSESTFSQNSASGFGGGMFLYESDLTLSTSTISSNDADVDGGGLYSENSSLSLTSSTFSGNSATKYGGGIRSVSGDLLFRNSTLSTNTAGVSGGGLYNDTLGAKLQLVTISDNHASSAGAGIFNVSPTLTLQNSIIANSVSGGDCYGLGVVVDTASIIEDASCSAARSGDPSLLALDDNGGPTQTHALGASSAARNTGDNANCLSNDQRGELRDDGRCDVGAYEEPSEDGGFIVIPIIGGQKVVVVPL